jgi:hypothetical protein
VSFLVHINHLIFWRRCRGNNIEIVHFDILIFGIVHFDILHCRNCAKTVFSSFSGGFTLLSSWCAFRE